MNSSNEHIPQASYSQAPLPPQAFYPQAVPSHPSQGASPWQAQSQAPYGTSPWQVPQAPQNPVAPGVAHQPPAAPPMYGNPTAQPGTVPPVGVPTHQASFETLIGKNVIGILAACLVFLGLLFLGFLAIPSLSDAVKIALMFIFSIALTTIGTLLTRRGKNAFTLALLACGSGSLFISIMLCHVFFRAIPDIVAFGLLLGWLAGSLALVKLSNSRLMSILVHVGMIFSICFAYAIGMSQDRIVLLLAYHALSVAMITIGNKLCFEKSYCLGLFCSLFLSLVAINVMFGYYLETLPTADLTQIIIALCAFVIQVIGASLLSFAIYRSMQNITSASTRVVLHVINKVLLLIIFFVALYLVSGLFADTLIVASNRIASSQASLLVASLMTLFAASIHMLIDMLLQGRKIQQGQTTNSLEMISIFIMAIYAALILFANYLFSIVFAEATSLIPGLFLIALVCIAGAHITNIKTYSFFALTLLGIDFFFMIFGGYRVLVGHETIAAALLYLLFCSAIIVFEWWMQGKERRAELFTGLRIALLVLYELSIISIFSAAKLGDVAPLLALSIALIVLSLPFANRQEKDSSAYWIFMRVNELLLVLVGAWAIAFRTPNDAFAILSLLLAAANITILVMLLGRIKSETRFEVSWLSIFVGIGFTLTALAAVAGLTDWFEAMFASSIVVMATALVCILTGFLLRMKPLRLYGLILVIICVVKLVTLDIGAAETMMRVIAFIVGGLICFGISALYNYSVKRFEESPHA